MSKCKADTESKPEYKEPNNSSDCFFYQPARIGQKTNNVSTTKIANRPRCMCCLDINETDFPLRFMLDLGSTSFVISPEAAKAFKIPVVERMKK